MPLIQTVPVKYVLSHFKTSLLILKNSVRDWFAFLCPPMGQLMRWADDQACLGLHGAVDDQSHSISAHHTDIDMKNSQNSVFQCLLSPSIPFSSFPHQILVNIPGATSGETSVNTIQRPTTSEPPFWGGHVRPTSGDVWYVTSRLKRDDGRFLRLPGWRRPLAIDWLADFEFPSFGCYWVL